MELGEIFGILFLILFVIFAIVVSLSKDKIEDDEK